MSYLRAATFNGNSGDPKALLPNVIDLSVLAAKKLFATSQQAGESAYSTQGINKLHNLVGQAFSLSMSFFATSNLKSMTLGTFACRAETRLGI